MSSIFLSYDSSDRSSAAAVVHVLKKRGWNVWWDPKIPPGKAWPEVIEEAISSASCVVVLWSKASVDSKWVRKEARYAERHKVLIPVRIEEVEVPFEFDHLQAARLEDWNGSESHSGLEDLCSAIAEIVSPAPAKSRSPAMKKRPPRERGGSHTPRPPVTDTKSEPKAAPAGQPASTVVERRARMPKFVSVSLLAIVFLGIAGLAFGLTGKHAYTLSHLGVWALVLLGPGLSYLWWLLLARDRIPAGLTKFDRTALTAWALAVACAIGIRTDPEDFPSAFFLLMYVLPGTLTAVSCILSLKYWIRSGHASK